uniref:Uncharacterized protein n=1 Tax=Onchocerca volvulus TaxID=6282 RepID=A0A8R1U1C7_ONCVO
MFESANLSRRMDNYDSSVQEAHRRCHKIKSTNGGCTTTGSCFPLYSLTFAMVQAGVRASVLNKQLQ